MKRSAKNPFMVCHLLFLIAMVLGLSLIRGVAWAKIYADRETKLYHRDFCPAVEKIKPSHLRIFESESAAESRNYYPCKNCVPPAHPPSFQVKQIKQLSLPVARDKKYYGDRSLKIYHNEWCEIGKKISDKNRVTFSSAKEAIEQEYEPCKECNPPAMFKRNKVNMEAVAGEKSGEDELPPAEMDTVEEEATEGKDSGMTE